MEIHGKTTIPGKVHSVDICKEGVQLLVSHSHHKKFQTFMIPWHGDPAFFNLLPDCRAEITVTVFEEGS